MQVKMNLLRECFGLDFVLLFVIQRQHQISISNCISLLEMRAKLMLEKYVDETSVI